MPSFPKVRRMCNPQRRLTTAPTDSPNKRRRMEDDGPPTLAPPSRHRSLNAKARGKALATQVPRAEASTDWRQDVHVKGDLRKQMSLGQHADLRATAPTASPRNGTSVDSVSSHAATHSQLSYSSLSESFSRLSSLEVPSEEVEAVQRIWTSFDGPASASADGSVKLSATFGFATKDDAVTALEANRTSPAFPNDQHMQRRYESFLRSQAGMDKDWYMVRPPSLALLEASTDKAASRRPFLLSSSSSTERRTCSSRPSAPPLRQARQPRWTAMARSSRRETGTRSPTEEEWPSVRTIASQYFATTRTQIFFFAIA